MLELEFDYQILHSLYLRCLWFAKNKGLDRTTPVVLCLIIKLFLGPRELSSFGMDNA